MKSRNSRGFTLIEMLIVVTIIGILAAIVMPRFLSSSDQAKKNAHKTERQNINAQLELYYFDNGSYPTAMTEAGWGGAQKAGQSFPDGVPAECNQGAAYTIDNGRISISNHTGHE